MASIEEIKELRQQTGVSVSECKKALEESSGDLKKAKELLRQWGKEVANKKSERETSEGIIDSYIHPNKKLGVLLELNCETDFVAKSKEFQDLAHEICLQIAAAKPLFLQEEDIPEDFLGGERKIYEEQVKDSGKPEDIKNQIVEGKLKKYKEEISLLSQPWIKSQDKTVRELLKENVAKIGENISIKSFKRFEI